MKTKAQLQSQLDHWEYTLTKLALEVADKSKQMEEVKLIIAALKDEIKNYKD